MPSADDTNSLIHSDIHKYLPPAFRLNSIFDRQFQLVLRANSDDIPEDLLAQLISCPKLYCFLWNRNNYNIIISYAI
jgi:hypothetical protein